MSSDRPTEQLRYQKVSKTARDMLATEGESGQFEFKRTADAVKSSVLVAAANWVALSPRTRAKVTLLVGVDEETDPATGLVKGVVVGLEGDLHKHIEKIQNNCRDTFPVPVGLRIIEEGVATPKPFLRLEIWPTLPPHFDSGGRRIVRNNASTRPLMDEELLDLYLDREGEKFEQRFGRTATHLLESLETVNMGVDQLIDTLAEVGEKLQEVTMTLSDVTNQVEDAAAVAGEAAEQAEESKSLGEMLDHDMQLLRNRADRSPVEVFFQLRHERLRVWVFFLNDAEFRPTKQTPKLETQLREKLEAPIDPNDWARNGTELAYWKDFLAKRNRRGTMTAWARALTELGQVEPVTAFPLGDEDGIRRLREEFRKKGDGKVEPLPYPDNEVIERYK